MKTILVNKSIFDDVIDNLKIMGYNDMVEALQKAKVVPLAKAPTKKKTASFKVEIHQEGKVLTYEFDAEAKLDKFLKEFVKVRNAAIDNATKGVTKPSRMDSYRKNVFEEKKAEYVKLLTDKGFHELSIKIIRLS